MRSYIVKIAATSAQDDSGTGYAPNIAKGVIGLGALGGAFGAGVSKVIGGTPSFGLKRGAIIGSGIGAIAGLEAGYNRKNLSEPR
jgi:hypothetical protein